MANIEVATWAELVSAIESFTDGDTIKITADIDLTSSHPYGVGKITLDADKTYIIDGGYTMGGFQLSHIIKGLSNNLSSPEDLFYAPEETTGFKLLNIDFYNITLANGDFYKNTNADAPKVEFTRVRFLGSRTGNSYLINAKHIKVVSCYFNIPWNGLNQSNLAYTSLAPKPANSNTAADYEALYCWFHEHYGGWIVPRYMASNSQNYNSWSCFCFKLSGCYVDGDMTVSTYVQGPAYVACEVLQQATVWSYTPSAMNVLDVDITCTANQSIAAYGYWFGVYIDKVKQANGNPVSSWSAGYDVGTSKPRPLIATVSEAKDAQWLNSHGFDIAYP